MKRLSVIFTLLFSTAVHAHPDPAHTLADLDKHLAETPDDLLLISQKGELLLRAGQPDLATAVVNEGLRKSPSDPALLLLHAHILDSRGDRAAAFAQTERVTRDHPTFPKAWSDLARLHHDAGRRDEAIAAKLRHLEIEEHPGPGDFLAASAWLKSRGKESDINNAIAILDRGIAAYESLTALPIAAIELECDAGQFNAALERVSGLVTRNGPSVRFSIMRTGIYETAGRYEEAANACDSALALLELSSADAALREKLLLRKQRNLNQVTQR